jgi:hypothetical protein
MRRSPPDLGTRRDRLPYAGLGAEARTGSQRTMRSTGAHVLIGMVDGPELYYARVVDRLRE